MPEASQGILRKTFRFPAVCVLAYCRNSFANARKIGGVQLARWGQASRHRGDTLGRASPAHSGIRQESSPLLPRTVFFHERGSSPAESLPPRGDFDLTQ